MKIRHLTTLASVLLFASMGVSHATLTGINLSPLGTHGSTDVGYVIWDTFPSASFSGVTSSDTSGLESGTLGQSVTTGGGGFGPVSGDYFYDSGGASGTSWTVTAEADFDVNYIVLQIKLTPPAGPVDIASYFAPQLSYTGIGSPLSGGTPSVVLVSPTQTVFGQDVRVVTWQWNNVGITQSTEFNITFGHAPGMHVATDTIALDVATVPEPSTYAMLATAALGFAGWAYRRRKARAA